MASPMQVRFPMPQAVDICIRYAVQLAVHTLESCVHCELACMFGVSKALSVQEVSQFQRSLTA